MTDETKPTLDQFHWHEMLDRLHVVKCMFDDFILSHPCADHKALKLPIEAVADSLYVLYQHAGTVEFEETGQCLATEN